MTDAICYSGALSRNAEHILGTPHYSYRFAEEKFLRCFESMELAAHFVAMPEFYSAPQAYEQLPTFNGLRVHVVFRSTEDIRILKSGYNISCYAWEFPFLKDTTAVGEHPFLNQKRMLLLCNEIWVPCRYTKDVLNAHGIDDVYVIPAPITAAAQSKLTRADILAHLGHINTKPFASNFLNHGASGSNNTTKPLYSAFAGSKEDVQRKIFLSIFNPEDFRKNLDALIKGFDAFQQRTNRGDLLIIKALTAKERFDLGQVVSNVMANKLASGTAIANENILVFNELLSSEEMLLLYDLADFYVCTSIAEGQNLPLQEAMIRGVVPVTTLNTAMLDYIDDENAVVIAADRQWNSSEHLAGNIAGKPYEVEICTSTQVAAALGAAVALDDEAYERRSRAARAKIEESYTCERVSRLVSERLSMIEKRLSNRDA